MTVNPYLAEFIGTALLLLLGIGVVANVCLKKTKGSQQNPWVLTTCAWGFAVFVGVYVAGPSSGAHLNPAITIALATLGNFQWNLVPGYLLAQFLGAMAGSWITYLVYIDHFKRTEDEIIVRGTFCTIPAIKNYHNNFFSELVGTFVLVFGVLCIVEPNLNISDMVVTNFGLGSLDALPVGILVWVIGMGLGGTTGYAINPARDFGPRLIYSLIPRRHKNADWGYSWIPIVAPTVGGVLAAMVYNIITI